MIIIVNETPARHECFGIEDQKGKGEFMYGAILGDIIGSPYEFDENNIKTKEFELFSDRSEFTDDTVMTVAVAEALMDAGKGASEDDLKKALVNSMKKYGNRYPLAGYGMNFSLWLAQDDPQPYNSMGNGSAMRVSSAAWLNQDDFEEMRRVARTTAVVSHNHPEGIKGAECVACVIFMAIHGRSKQEIRDFVTNTFHYDLSKTCDEIRPTYHHVETCQATVPPAITAFLEGNDFEDVIRTAVSLGGDCDTLTAIAGSMAEAFYGVPDDLKAKVRVMLPEDLLAVVDRFEETLRKEQVERKTNPAKQKAWENAFAPKKAAGSKNVGDGTAGNEAIEQAIAAMHQNRTQQTVAGVLEAVRKRMDADGKFMIPIAASQEEIRTGKLKDLRNLRFKTVKTGDGKVWQPVYTTRSHMQKIGAKHPFVVTIPMRMFFHQFTDTNSKVQVPESLSGIAINPEGQNFLLNRGAIRAILQADKMAQSGTKLLIAKGDITKIKCDAIVNAANNALAGGSGVNGAIQAAAGPQLLEECHTIGGCETGKAVITKGYNLPAQHVIHTVGPVYSGKKEDAELLADCYRNSLNLARENSLHSIAFPAISTGVYGYPLEDAAKVAVQAVFRWMRENTDYGMQIIFCCFDDKSQQIYAKLLGASTGSSPAKEQ